MNNKNILKAPKSTLVGLLLILLIGVGLATGVLTDYTFAGLVFTTGVAMLPTNWFKENKNKI